MFRNNIDGIRQCLSLLQRVFGEYLAAPFTPENSADVSRILNRLRKKNIYDEAKQILRREVSVHCYKISKALTNTRNNKDYLLCFINYLADYFTSIRNIVASGLPRLLSRYDSNSETRDFLEERFRSIVIKNQQDRLSSILLRRNSPNINEINLHELLSRL